MLEPAARGAVSSCAVPVSSRAAALASATGTCYAFDLHPSWAGCRGGVAAAAVAVVG